MFEKKLKIFIFVQIMAIFSIKNLLFIKSFSSIWSLEDHIDHFVKSKSLKILSFPYSVFIFLLAFQNINSTTMCHNIEC